MTNETNEKREAFEELVRGVEEMLISAKRVGKTRTGVLRDYVAVSADMGADPDFQKKSIRLIKEIMDATDY